MLGSNCRLLGTNSQPRAHCQSWVQHNLAIQVAPLIIIIFIFPICFQIQTLTASRSAPTLGSKNSTTSPSMQVSHSVIQSSSIQQRTLTSSPFIRSSIITAETNLTDWIGFYQTRKYVIIICMYRGKVLNPSQSNWWPAVGKVQRDPHRGKNVCNTNVLWNLYFEYTCGQSYKDSTVTIYEHRVVV